MLNMKKLKQNTLKKKTTSVKYATKPQATCITKKGGVNSCAISPLSWLFAVRATTNATTK
jgi:hypothetical protein